jgi:hypothetical protein
MIGTKIFELEALTLKDIASQDILEKTNDN